MVAEVGTRFAAALVAVVAIVAAGTAVAAGLPAGVGRATARERLARENVSAIPASGHGV
jgi:hypothetical protein